MVTNNKKKVPVAAVLLAGVTLSACESATETSIAAGPYPDVAIVETGPSELYFPKPEDEGGWRTLVERNEEPSAAQKHEIREVAGVDWDALEAAWELSEELGGGSTVLVIRNGWIVGEWGSTRQYNVASVTKSLTSLATIRMIDLSKMGHLPVSISMDSLAHDFLPQAFAESDELKRNIQIRHLLTMSPGILPTDPDRLSMSERVEYPMDAHVGKEWVYSSLPPNLLSMIIQNVTGRPYGEFFNTEIASAIGAQPLRWEEISGGYTKGAAGASVSARGLARIAYLTLNDGVWESDDGYRQVVDAGRLNRTIQWAPFLETAEFRESPDSPFPLPEDAPNHYGYLWWTNRTQVALGADVPDDAYYMHGFRDNLAIVVPSEDLIVIRLARSGPSTEPAFRREFMSRVMAAVVRDPPPVSRTASIIRPH